MIKSNYRDICELFQPRGIHMELSSFNYGLEVYTLYIIAISEWLWKGI